MEIRHSLEPVKMMTDFKELFFFITIKHFNTLIFRRSCPCMILTPGHFYQNPSKRLQNTTLCKLFCTYTTTKMGHLASSKEMVTGLYSTESSRILQNMWRTWNGNFIKGTSISRPFIQILESHKTPFTCIPYHWNRTRIIPRPQLQLWVTSQVVSVLCLSIQVK